MSKCKAEYLAALAAAQKLMWLHRSLSDLERALQTVTVSRLNNNAAVLVANRTSPTKHRKYIDLRHQILQHFVKRGDLAVNHTPSISMLADILTKFLENNPSLTCAPSWTSYHLPSQSTLAWRGLLVHRTSPHWGVFRLIRPQTDITHTRIEARVGMAHFAVAITRKGRASSFVTDNMIFFFRILAFSCDLLTQSSLIVERLFSRYLSFSGR